MKYLQSFVLIACAGVALGAPHNDAITSSAAPVTTYAPTISTVAETAYPTSWAGDGGGCNLFPTPSYGIGTTGFASGSTIYLPPVQTVTVTVVQNACGGGGTGRPRPSGAVSTSYAWSPEDVAITTSAAAAYPVSTVGSPDIVVNGTVIYSNVPHAYPTPYICYPYANGTATFDEPAYSTTSAVPEATTRGGVITGRGDGTIYPSESRSSYIGAVTSSVAAIPFPTYAFPDRGAPVLCHCQPIQTDYPATCGYATATSAPWPDSTSYATEYIATSRRN